LTGVRALTAAGYVMADRILNSLKEVGKMAKVIITAQVQDMTKWEQTFRKHTELFRSYRAKAVEYGMAEGNAVGVCFEVEDAASALKMIRSQATAEAMDIDGVLRETARILVLDKEVKL
jgi:hypothetical protein